ncbi:MAG: peptide chain release factor 1 [Psychromonas sp.]|nr:peptide chain release factor 1 [Psychromonas sp.]
MQATVLTKLDTLVERYEEIQVLLGSSEILNDQVQYRALTKEYAQLEVVVLCFKTYQGAIDDLEAADMMLDDDDQEIRNMALDESENAKILVEKFSNDLQLLLLAKDSNDDLNCYIEIRAGAGGDEAAIFAGNLFRMYSKFIDTKKWRLEEISSNTSEKGGYKQIIAKIEGNGAYGLMKFESGGHRVQRVPETESQGRVHTSACTVVVMPEIPEADAISINTADLKVDTFRASGAGGQHVNKTDSAIRITHLPTGTVVECQEQRSQHKNRAQAMSVLQARLQQSEDEKNQAEEHDLRRRLVASGDRSERIRTYNYPQGRVSDHRINLTLYSLNEILDGNLNALLGPILLEDQADKLTQLSESDF